MDDKDTFSDQNENESTEHTERVSDAFSSLKKRLGGRFTSEEKRLLDIREATLRRDKPALEEHLKATKFESSWLYDELMKHPEISAILSELSIMGL